MEEEHSLCMERGAGAFGPEMEPHCDVHSNSKQVESGHWQLLLIHTFILAHFYSFTLPHFQATYITQAESGQPPPPLLPLSLVTTHPPFGSEQFSALPNSVCPQRACLFSFMVTSVCMACFSSQPWWWCWWRGHTLMSVHSTQLSYTCIQIQHSIVDEDSMETAPSWEVVMWRQALQQLPHWTPSHLPPGSNYPLFHFILHHCLRLSCLLLFWAEIQIPSFTVLLDTVPIPSTHSLFWA